MAKMWKGFGSVLELKMESFHFVDAFLAFWPLKKLLIKIKSQKESSNFSEVENNIKVEMIFRAGISGMFNDKSDLPEQRKAELIHNDGRFFPLLPHLILSTSLHIAYKDGKVLASDHMCKLGNLSFAKRQMLQIKVFIHRYIYE